MRRFISIALAVCTAAALAACSHSSLQQNVLPSQPALQYSAPQVSSMFPELGPMPQEALAVMQAPRFRACDTAPRGYETCYAIMSRISINPNLSPRASCLHFPGCYVASDLQGAYGLTSASKSGGKGVTVAVVDAYGYTGGYKAAASDLAAYRKLAGLPPCGSTCFKIVNQAGGSKLPKPPPAKFFSWQGEEMLDVDMVSAICPNCKILLVQTNTSLNKDLLKGEVTALKMATIVSNSWGGAEVVPTYPVFDTHPGKVITASAGDDGAGAPVSQGGNSPESQPCGFTGVVCAGGTSLLVSHGSYVSEKVWEDFHYVYKHKAYDLGATGSGCSAMVAKPAWQTDTGCTMRSAVDISANADPITGVVIACTPCAKAYNLTPPYLAGLGGTSESSPLIAAMYALAGNAGSLTSAPETIWTSGASNFHDVTSGFNDSAHLSPPLGTDTRTGLICTTAIAYICKAGAGYDGPTGMGSPSGLGAL